MTINDQQIFLMEEFKIPFLDPFCPGDWKDWYHYILYNPVTKARLLYNLCFNGKPGSGYVADTLFLTLPKGFVQHHVSDAALMETYGFARNIKWEENDLMTDPLKYYKDEIAFSVYDKLTCINVSNISSGIAINISGKPVATPVYLPELAPYGNGFMGWGVIPGFQMEGDILIGNKKIIVDKNWYCYHDRNFGRFNWGNIGWTWFVLNAIDGKGKEWTYILHRSNNKDYSKKGAPLLFVYRENKLKKIFLGATIDIQLRWEKTDNIPPILPGAMASVFSDRSIFMPKQIIVIARDEKDNVFIKMDINTQSELIVSDNETKQYTFLKELSGQASSKHLFNNIKTICREGFFYAELVH